MSSFLRKVGRRKKSKVLGEVEVMDREQTKTSTWMRRWHSKSEHVAEVLERGGGVGRRLV